MITHVPPAGRDVKHCMVNSTFMPRELVEVDMLEFSLCNHYTMHGCINKELECTLNIMLYEPI